MGITTGAIPGWKSAIASKICLWFGEVLFTLVKGRVEALKRKILSEESFFKQFDVAIDFICL
jgi:hypothetical protein